MENDDPFEHVIILTLQVYCKFLHSIILEYFSTSLEDLCSDSFDEFLGAVWQISILSLYLYCIKKYE